MKKMKKMKKKKMKGERDSGIACEVGTIKETVNMCELDFFFLLSMISWSLYIENQEGTGGFFSISCSFLVMAFRFLPKKLYLSLQIFVCYLEVI